MLWLKCVHIGRWRVIIIKIHTCHVCLCHETLERGRRAEQLMKIKDDRRIRSEILRAAKGEVSAPPVKTRGRRGKRGGSH